MKQKTIDKSTLNLLIDFILLLLILPIAGLGLLIRYVLVPGFKRDVLYGRNVELEFWGQNRHEWGSIHLIVSLVFLALLLLHIILHWKMICSIFRRMIPTKTIRIGLVSISTLLCLALVSFPLFVQPEIHEKEPLHRNEHTKKSTITPVKSIKSKIINHVDAISGNQKTITKNTTKALSDKETMEVLGSQTLQFVADKYNVPATIIASDLKIPQTLCSEKLGRLKKKYPFTMDDVKASISNYKEKE